MPAVDTQAGDVGVSLSGTRRRTAADGAGEDKLAFVCIDSISSIIMHSESRLIAREVQRV